MNRIILKVEIKDEKSAKLTLVYIDKRFLSTGEHDFKYFYEDSEDFMLYSFSKLTYTINALKFPSLTNYKPMETLEVTFLTEAKLKKWLKSLYNTLHKWNNNYTPFVKEIDHENRPKRMILNKENWIL